MGSVIPVIAPIVGKVATSFLVNKITDSVFGSSNTSFKSSANSGAFSAEFSQAGVQEASAILVNKNSNNAALPIMYGRRRMGGTRVLVETCDPDWVTQQADNTNGTSHLAMVIAVADGMCGWPSKVYFDEEIIWNIDGDGSIINDGGGFNPAFDGGALVDYEGQAGGNIWQGKNIYMEWFRGSYPAVTTSSYIQQAVGNSVWTNNHLLHKVAYLAVVLEANPDYYEGTVPTITVEFDGQIYMPLTSANVAGYRAAADHEAYYIQNSVISGPEGVNPVDILYNYLSSTFYGKSLDFDGFTGEWYPDQDIDLDSFEVARAYCEELVDRGAGLVPRYSINGVMQTSSTVYENVDMLVNSFNGMLIYTNGRYVLKIRKPNETSTFSFDRNNILGDIELNLSGANQRLNRVAVAYSNPTNNFNDDIYYAFDATSFAEDNYKILEAKVDMPLITDTTLIQQLAQYKIDNSRQQITVDFTAPHTAMKLECGDIIDITHDMFQWTNKLFRVISMEILADNTVSIMATEYNSDIEI